MDRPAIVPIQDQHDSSDEPHAKRQAQLLTWTNRRTRVTQACDRCRERKRQCDYLLPRCGRCQKVNKDCTFLAVQKTRGRPLGSSNSNTNKGTPNPSSQTMDNSNDRRDRQGPSSVSTPCTTGPAGPLSSSTNESRANIASSSAPALHSLHMSAPSRSHLLPTPSSSTPAMSFLGRSPLYSSITTTPGPKITATAAAATATSLTLPTTLATTNSHSQEVIDHLLGIFFEHCFYYFNFFDPVAFLGEYDQGIADSCLIDAMCAIAARFSTHPAVLASPPYLSGEPFAVRVRAALSRQVISEVTMSYLHTTLLLTFYEYSSGRSLQGYHFGGMACRMAPELRLHGFHSTAHQEEDDNGQYSEDDDDEQDYRGHIIDIDAPQPRPHQTPSLSSEEARMANQVKARTFFFLVIIDTVAAVLSGLPPAIDAARYQLPEPTAGQRDWWVRTDRRKSTNTGRRESSIMSSVSTPIPGPVLTFGPMRQNKSTTIISGATFSSTSVSTNTNTSFEPGNSRISPPSSSSAAVQSPPRIAQSASLPRPSTSPLSASSPPLYSHLNPTPTPPTHSPLPVQPLPSYSLRTTTTTATETAPSPTAGKATASVSSQPLRNNDGPLFLSAFSQSILRVLSSPQLILGREPLEHYCTLIPITAAVMKLTNHGCAAETNSTMMLRATSSSSSSSPSSARRPSSINLAQSGSQDTNSGTDMDNLQPTLSSLEGTTINSSSSGKGTAAMAFLSTSHGPPHPPSPPLLRNSKRRRANPIFTSRERKIAFQKADEDLQRWAEQLPEEYRPMKATSSFQQQEPSPVNLSVFYYLMVMVLHRPILVNANLAANRSQQEGGGGGGGGGGTSFSTAATIVTAATETATTITAGRVGAVGATAVRSRVGAEHDDDEGSPFEQSGDTVMFGDIDMVSRSHSEETVEKETVVLDDEEDEAEEHARDGMEMESWIEENSNKGNKDDKGNNVRKKLKGRGGKNERDKNDYDSDDAEDLQTIELSTQRCIEAAHAIISIIRNFDDTHTKYHGGHHTFTVYLAGTILIMELSKTEDPATQTQIYEGLEVCFRFFSILSPYWKDADEKAKTLRDLLSIHANKNKQQGDSDDEEEEGDGEDYDGDGDGDNDSGGGGIEGDEGDDDYSADDDGGAEQSLQDLIIADALLDLSNRPPRDDYGWGRRKTTSRSMLIPPSSFSLPSTSLPAPGPLPPLRPSRSESSLSEYRCLGPERQLFAPVTTSTTRTTTARQRRPTVHQHALLPPTSSAFLQHATIPSDHFASIIINYTINSASTTATTTIITPNSTTTTSGTTDPTTPICFVDRIIRGQEGYSGEGGGMGRHTVNTGISAFLKMDKNRTLPPPSPPSPPSPPLHHHIHNNRRTTTWVGGGIYPECNNRLDETILISLDKLCLSIESPLS